MSMVVVWRQIGTATSLSFVEKDKLFLKRVRTELEKNVKIVLLL